MIPQLIIIAGSIAALLSAMVAIRWLAKKYDWTAEVQRKLVHVGTGMFALTLPWLFSRDWPIFALLAATLVVMAILRLPALSSSGIGATIHGVERRSLGDFYLTLSVGIVFVLSEREPVLYILPLAILTLSDAAAALAGSSYGRRRFFVEDGEKTIEGSVIFFMVTMILSMVLLLVLTDVPRVNVVTLSLMIAAFGTLIEAESWRGLDNLFLPVGILLFLFANLETSPTDLMLLAAFFLIVFGVIGWLGRYLGFAPHASHVYVVGIFLIFSVVTPNNAVLPVLMLGAHAAARTLKPSAAENPDLEILTALALVSFAWLVAGTVTGMNALSFYGLTFVGLAVTLGTIAVSVQPIWLRLSTPALLALIFGGLYLHLISLNLPVAQWHGDMVAFLAISLAMAVGVPLMRPGWFDWHRVPKTLGISLAVPVLAYLWNMAEALS